MAILNLIDQINNESKRIDNMEHILGKCLNQPFSNTCSGSRKILFSTQFEQKLPLINPELPLISTGYENQFGENSSSFIKAEHNFEVLKKIRKYEGSDIQYCLIVKNLDTNEIDVIDRDYYCHITESYGYLYDNKYLDRLDEHSMINSGDVYKKSTSFDDFNNRMDGVNLEAMYLACNPTTEDGIVISETAAKKLSAPLIKTVTIIVNDNDIPLNLYGDNTIYKAIPNIGEDIKNGLLCAIRRERKEECLFTQSVHQLKNIMMTDDKFTVHGKVINVNIYCNNPEKLQQNDYTAQFKYYYDQSQRFADELVRFTNSYINAGYTLSYDLQKLHSINKRILNGEQFIKDKLFSNIIMEISLLDEIPMGIGDKLTDRYGGKGVVSQIRPDELMPLLDNGQRVEIIYHQSTCINRLNIGQLYEVSINHITERICEYINTKVFDASQYIDLYIKLIKHLSKEQGIFIENALSQMSDEEAIWYLDDLVEHGIFLSLKPISDSLTLDTLSDIYKEFSWATPYNIIIPIKDSNGTYRYIESRRTIPCGKKYIYRLKQYAGGKFSSTSMSSTNLKNETSRNRLSKDYKSPYPRTPIRFGEMEMGEMGHLGMEIAIVQLMIYSVSPIARRSCEQMLTGDPFNIDIKLDNTASNRSVEIFNAYFKAMGYRLTFNKVKKKYYAPFAKSPIKYVNVNAPMVDKYPIQRFNNESMFKYDMQYMHQEIIDRCNGYTRPLMRQPIQYLANHRCDDEDLYDELQLLSKNMPTKEASTNWKYFSAEDGEPKSNKPDNNGSASKAKK